MQQRQVSGVWTNKDELPVSMNRYSQVFAVLISLPILNTLVDMCYLVDRKYVKEIAFSQILYKMMKQIIICVKEEDNFL